MYRTILLPFILSAVLAMAAHAETIDLETARRLVATQPEKVRMGYAEERFHHKNTVWWSVESCWGGERLTLGARSICLVCAIDDTSGMTYSALDWRRGTWILPDYALGYTASYAYYLHRPEGWTFERYAPFAMNLYASNREPYHRADLTNMKGEALKECRELHYTSGYE